VKDSLRAATAVVCLAGYAATAIAYVLVGAITADNTQHTLVTGLDTAIPYVPELVFGYLTLYLLPFVLILAIPSRRHLREAVISYAVVNLVAFPIYLVYPVYCPKPSVDTSSVSGWLLAMEHSWDTPMNSFPSLHACFALLVWFWTRDRHPLLSAATFANAVLIGVSALFVKQHYAADIVAGYVLAWGAYQVGTKSSISTDSARRRSIMSAGG
jgi:membrane-associated phospholipid phosphatase